MLNQTANVTAFGLSDLDPLANQQIIEFLATSTDAVFVVDAQWQFVYLSPNGEVNMGRTSADLVGKNLWEEYPAALGTRFYFEYQRAMRDRVSISVEDYYAPLGRWFEAHASPFQSGLLFYFRDISKRKQAEEQLLEHAALLNHAQEAIIACDPDGRVIFWNPGAERIYGWTAEESLGRNLRTEVYTEEQMQAWADVRQVLQQKGEWAGEWRQVTKDGRELIVESRCTVVRDAQGKHKATLITNNDITEKKRMEAQYMRAQRLESIGALASGIAHDLNNLLSPMMMVEHILQLKFPDPHSQRLLETLRSSIQRASGLVKQVVSFARGNEGDQTTLCPKYLLKDIKQLLLETFPRSIQIVADEEADLWAITGDATQLFQVLMNLCVNARDAMPDGGTLTLAAEKVELQDASADGVASAGSYVRFLVEDTGTGIPVEIRDQIFDPFFTTKEQGRGTGLGLATALRIVTAHCGFIEVESEVGQGSQFKVYLPATLEEPSVLVDSDSLTLPVGNGELILVIEDEAAIREVTRETLETYGYQVITASEGAEAVALYAQHLASVRAVLLDMVIPLMDGRAIIRALHKLNPHCRMIATSGMLSADQDIDGVAQFLPKPFTAEKLLKTLAAVIQTESPSVI